MRRFVRCGLFIGMVLLATAGLAGPIFRARSLITSPTAETLPFGRFEAALHGAYRLEKPYRRATTGIALDAGVLSWVQGGVSWERDSATGDDRLLWEIRVRLVREQGGTPSVGVTVSGLGEGRGTRSAFVLGSKQLNLPKAGFFRVHAGIRQRLDPSLDAGKTTPLVGVEKRWPARDRTLRGVVEWDGETAYLGVEQRYRQGLHLALAVAFDTPRFLFSIGFGNEEFLNEVEAAKRLAKQAARLATTPADP